MWVPSWPGEFVVVLSALTSALRQEKEMDIPQNWLHLPKT